MLVNIFADAINIFDESVVERSVDELRVDLQRVSIGTQQRDSHNVELCISDNGNGVTETCTRKSLTAGSRRKKSVKELV